MKNENMGQLVNGIYTIELVIKSNQIKEWIQKSSSQLFIIVDWFKLLILHHIACQKLLFFFILI